MVRAEHLEELRVAADLFDRADDRAIGRVALHLDEEEVLPALARRRARLDLREVHAALGELLEHLVERSRRVAHGEDDAR